MYRKNIDGPPNKGLVCMNKVGVGRSCAHVNSSWPAQSPNSGEWWMVDGGWVFIFSFFFFFAQFH